MKNLWGSAALAVSALLALSAPAFAQSLGKSGQAGEMVSNPVRVGDAPAGSIPLTQSLSNAITPLNSVACLNTGTGYTLENRYLRRFLLDADHGINSGFSVNSVDVGFEALTEGGAGACTGNPIAVNIFSIPSGAAMNYGNMSLVESNSVNIGGQSAPAIFNFPLGDPGEVNGATDDLVVEVRTCDHSSLGDGGREFIGSNSAGQTGPSYLAAPGCGLSQPTPTSAIGFPGMHIVMTVYGDAGEPPDLARFAVSKVFDDGNTAEVDVELSCNTGLPLSQPATISAGDPVNFVVGDFAQGELNCTVTETVPDGYTASYTDNDGNVSSDGCSWEGVTGGQYTCVITNSLDLVEVEVTKVWIDENPQFNSQNVAGADWSCSDVIFGNDDGFLNFDGNPDSQSFYVYPRWDGITTCSITEVDLFESGVEVDDSDCQGLSVTPGSGASCTIFNTRLYEGIPTLSHYGLALMALLMLGVGFVAFRRFS